ncbi:MAG: sulfite exporter TauE/SafE family protein [Patescibacteria group bacterium]
MDKKLKTTNIRITGMHCASCDVLVKTKLRGQGNILEVEPDQKKNILKVKHKGELSLDAINSILCDFGYKVSSLEEVIVGEKNQYLENIKEAAALILIVGAVIYLVNDLKVIPDFTSNPSYGLGGSLLLGVIASFSTCMATTGALLAGYLHLVKDQKKVLNLTLLFLAGRLISYGFFGYLLGVFGGLMSSIIQFGGIINIFVAAVLFVVGFDMLKLISLGALMDAIPGMQKVKTQISLSSTAKTSYAGSFLLGISTYFLPCGFSLTTQAYAVTLGNPLGSAITMMTFALGTVPSLFALSFISKIRNSNIYSHINKIIGVVVIFVGLSYIANTLNLYGINFAILGSGQTLEKPVEMIAGKQLAKMTATSSGYTPNLFVVKQGIPVRWEIFGKEIFGCQGTLQSPKAGVKLTYLKPGENVIEFTPTEKGVIQFSCSMGMFSGQFKVI